MQQSGHMCQKKREKVVVLLSSMHMSVEVDKNTISQARDNKLQQVKMLGEYTIKRRKCSGRWYRT